MEECMNQSVQQETPLRSFQRLHDIVASYPKQQSSLIPILQSVQAEFRYLPEEMLTFIASSLELSPATVYGVATFYAQFSTEPKGKHLIQVCDGTACHVRKGTEARAELAKALGLTGEQKTTPDLMFTLEKVSCIGACALAPAMMIDGQIYGQLTPAKAKKILDDIRRQEEEHAKA